MRYRADWLIPAQVFALTHYVPEVTPEDFMQIMAAAESALPQASQAFHLIIDNRIVQNEQIAPLAGILEAMPILKQSPLQWIVMVLPETIRHQAATMDVQREGAIQLKYVPDLPSAYQHLQSADDSIDWAARDGSFFQGDAQL